MYTTDTPLHTTTISYNSNLSGTKSRETLPGNYTSAALYYVIIIIYRRETNLIIVIFLTNSRVDYCVCFVRPLLQRTVEFFEKIGTL